MSEEEIKKLSREYAHHRAFDGGFSPKEEEIAEDFEVCLKLLSEDYCIVPKSKVIDLYDKYDAIGNEPERPKDYIESRYEEADGVCMGLEELFGSELFEQKGE